MLSSIFILQILWLFWPQSLVISDAYTIVTTVVCLLLCYIVWTQAASSDIVKFKCVMEILPNGQCMFKAERLDQTLDTSVVPSQENSVLSNSIEEDPLLNRLKDSKGIAQRRTCNRIMMQFLDLSNVS